MARGEATIKVKVEEFHDIVQGMVHTEQHDGYFVSSKDMPGHTEEMGIWVPWRFKRKHRLAMVAIHDKATLKEGGEGYLTAIEADSQLVEVLRQVGIQWNWESDGKPLPQPNDDPDVWGEISDTELMFIVVHIADATAIPPQKSTA